MDCKHFKKILDMLNRDLNKAPTFEKHSILFKELEEFVKEHYAKKHKCRLQFER